MTKAGWPVRDLKNVAEEHRLVDIDYLAELTGLSKPTLRRMNADQAAMPRGIRIGRRSIRWRLRTGEPKTGILDWIEAGCRLESGESPDENGFGQAGKENAHGC